MKSILLIEDEQALQRTLGDALTQAGFRVLSALDGEIGLRLAKDTKPDCILLDLLLPKLHGLAVLKSLKEDEDTRDIPVIVLTNLDATADVEQALAVGATTYLVKSNYTLEELVDKVRKTFNEH